MATPPNTRPQQLPPPRPQYHPVTTKGLPQQLPNQIPTSKSQFPGIPNAGALLNQQFFMAAQQMGNPQQGDSLSKQLQQAAQQAAQAQAVGFPQMYNIGQIAG